MPAKTLKWLESQYLDALPYAVLYGTALTLDAFAAAHHLEPEEREQWREYMGKRGIEE